MLEGLFLGLISWLSLIISWWHLPERIKRFCLNHPLLSDLSAGVFVYMVLSSISKSLVAAVGTVFAGLLVNFSILFAKWSGRVIHTNN